VPSAARNRGIGNPFFDSINDARFPIVSPLVTVDVGGGNFQPVVFDRFCGNASEPICQSLDANGNVVVNSSGTLRSFSALTSTTATLAQKGIVIENGVPHGYISLNTARLNERMLQALDEIHTVGQPRDAVIVGEVPDALLSALDLAHILDRAVQMLQVAVGVERADTLELDMTQ